MNIKELDNLLVEYDLKDIHLPRKSYFPIDDFKQIVPDQFHENGWCEYNTKTGQSVMIFDSEKFKIG